MSIALTRVESWRDGVLVTARTIQIVRVWDENDAANTDAQDEHIQQQLNRYHCAAHGCTWVLAEDDAVYVCAFCLARVVRDADVYDQESGVA